MFGYFAQFPHLKKKKSCNSFWNTNYHCLLSSWSAAALQFLTQLTEHCQYYNSGSIASTHLSSSDPFTTEIKNMSFKNTFKQEIRMCYPINTVGGKDTGIHTEHQYFFLTWLYLLFYSSIFRIRQLFYEVGRKHSSLSIEYTFPPSLFHLHQNKNKKTARLV